MRSRGPQPRYDEDVDAIIEAYADAYGCAHVTASYGTLEELGAQEAAMEDREQ